MKLSIIVPIYNASLYLERCIDSLLAQGLSVDEYEILLINDGSTDNSLDICLDFQKKESAIVKVFLHKNKGVSFTRNRGIKEAKGEYICFVDADDYLIPNGYRYLIDNYLERHIDVLSFWSMTLDKKQKKHFKENNEVNGKICYEITGRDFLKNNVQTFIWSSFYRSDFIKKHHLSFVSNMVIGEDVLFNINLYLKDPVIRMVSSRIYRYDLHEESVIHQRDTRFIRKAIDSYLQMYRTIQTFIDENAFDSDLCDGLRSIMKSQFFPFLSRLFSSDYSVAEMKTIRNGLIKKKVLPVDAVNAKEKIINIIFQTPRLIKVYEWSYLHLFVPYILPLLSRN